jgi:ribosome biogenesis protein YTM1
MSERDEDGGAKVRVRFTTTSEQYRITDAPFAIPSKLNRSGLSEIVNHMLRESENDDDHVRQPFDFMIGGRLVRMALHKFIAVHRLNTEDIITIEYFPGEYYVR